MCTKRVRFQSPNKMSSPESTECHSPRPCIVKKLGSSQIDLCYQYPVSQALGSKMDAIEYFDANNSIPYSAVQKSILKGDLVEKFKALPSSDLELSMLDVNDDCNMKNFLRNSNKYHPNTLESVFSVPTSDLYTKGSKCDDGFFLKPKNLSDAVMYDDISKSHRILDNKNVRPSTYERVDFQKTSLQSASTSTTNYKPMHMCIHCMSFENKENLRHVQNCCNSCFKTCNNDLIWQNNDVIYYNKAECLNDRDKIVQYHCCKLNGQEKYNCKIGKKQYSTNDVHCECSNCKFALQYLPAKVKDSVDHKRQTIEELEKSKAPSKCIDLNDSTIVAKPKRDATVSDLFKIIKLQNEQLQLLQDKVEKLITVKNTPVLMNQNFIQERVAVETVDQNNQKMSIGVMTSFEVVRTSTYINKGISKNQNAQIQCNRSEISVKEIVTNSQTVNDNFLEGITPCKTVENKHIEIDVASQEPVLKTQEDLQTMEKNYDDKTLNELSLYNFHIDNATTPQLSPDQTLYLDVRDYSESESENQSNIGWTYYNKVMTHVNCMLDDSEMPSSASALYRKANRQVQMQIDKSNFSVAKKVKFGDDPLGVITQQHVYHPQIYQPMVPATETSMKMNALAAKYLKTPLSHPVCVQPVLKSTPIMDLSFATRNYMEKHRLLPGTPSTSKKPQNDMPRFLDITALKQQPKLL